MSWTRPMHEWRFRRAFGRWVAGVGAAEEFPPGNEAGLRWVRALAQAEQGAVPGAHPPVLPEEAPIAFRAAALLWADRPEEAAELCLAGPDNPLALSLLGLARLEAGDAAAAAAAWRRQGPSPWRLTAPRALAVLLARSHRLEPEELALRLAADLREETPSRPPWPARLFRLGLDRLEGLGPGLRGDRGALGRIRVLSLAARGETAAAIALASALRRDLRQEPWPRQLLIGLLARAGEDRRILDLAAESPDQAGPVGLAQARLGLWPEARASLERLEHPEPVHLFALGAAHAAAGAIHAAARAFLQLNGRDELALVDLLDREAGLFLAGPAAP